MKKLNEILGTKYPIIQGAMANIATGEFAAACSNAGAFGIVAVGGLPPEKFEEEIIKCKKLTDKPFGVNIMLMHPQADDIADIIAHNPVAAVTTGAGNPGKYISMWKEKGIFVMPVVASVLLAERMVNAGADAVIAEGTESGGHVGEMTTMALVPQMVDRLDVPVIAAGGIADGRGMAAAYALGACGVQVGTCLLASSECPIHENYKQAVINAGDNATVVTGRSAHAPVRVLKNKMARKYLQMELKGSDRDELEKLTLGSLRKAVFDGDADNGSLMSGQICGLVKEIRPLAEIFEEMTEGCNRVIDDLQGR
jgi:enoyl-[acyl-carrier protein] reductase II